MKSKSKSKSKPTLLIADNSSLYRRSASTLFHRNGFRVVPVRSASGALAKLKKSDVDLALIDLRLEKDEDSSDFAGLSVAKGASAMRVPCIIVTAFPSVSATRSALRYNGLKPPLAVDFVPKAKGPRALLSAVDATLRVRGRRKARMPKKRC